MTTAVLGMQWGDEGKGKIAHLLARHAQMTVRFNGGPNAGHTIVDRGVKFGTHLIPAGAFYPGVMCVLASGMVIDMAILRKEVDAVREHLGRDFDLLLSENAHLILPYHCILEELEGSGSRLGTTRRGIGPAYRDKAARVGIRVGDLRFPDVLGTKLNHRLTLLQQAWPKSSEMGGLSAKDIALELVETSRPFMTSIGNAAEVIRRALDQGKDVLFEGAQGALLDIDFGTYPYVTSSSTTFVGLSHAIGVAMPRVDHRIGVVKAYTTRVGEGPFPTELESEAEAAWLREQGGEFGVTTGRPRRCGWLDLVALKYAVNLNAPTELAITKLDVLSGLDEIKICRAYRLGEEELTQFPLSLENLNRCVPLYEIFPGWSERIQNVRSYEGLPEQAKTYLQYLSRAVGTPIGMISVGPSPEETIATNFDTP